MRTLILTSLASNHLLPCTVAETAVRSSMISIQKDPERDLPLSPTRLWQPTVQGVDSEIPFPCGCSGKYLWIRSAHVSLPFFSQLGCTLPSLLLKHWWRRRVFQWDMFLKYHIPMSNQNTLFYCGPQLAAQITTGTPILHFLVDHAPSGRICCVFQNCFDLSSPPFVLPWDSEDPGQVQPCWVTAEISDKCVEESGTRRKRKMFCRAANSFGM